MLLHTIQFPSVCFQKKFYYGLLRCFMSCIANWRWKRCEKSKIIEIKWRIKEKLKELVGLTFTLNQTMGRNENNHKKWEITNSTHYSKSYFSWYFQSIFGDFFFSFMLLFDGCGNVKWVNEWNDVDYGTIHFIVCAHLNSNRPAHSSHTQTQMQTLNIMPVQWNVSSVRAPWAVSKRA